MKFLVAALIACLFALPIAQDQFPDVPIGPPIVMSAGERISAIMRRIGIHPLSGAPPVRWNRGQVATGVHASYKALSDQKLRKRLGAELGDIAAELKRLTATFEKELATIGVDVALMKARLKVIGTGFPDVPPDHWAARATLELRKKGLLKAIRTGCSEGIEAGRLCKKEGQFPKAR